MNERKCDVAAAEKVVNEVLQLLEARRVRDILIQLSETLKSPSEVIEAAWPLLTRRLYVDGQLLMAAGAGPAQSVFRVLRRAASEIEAESSPWTAESAAGILRRSAEHANVPMPNTARVVSIAITFGSSPLPTADVMNLLGQNECLRRLRHASNYLESAHLIG